MNKKQLYSRDAEEAVLGGVLIDPRTFSQIGLTAEDFYLETSQIIWDVYAVLFSMRKQIDFVTVVEGLGSKLEDVGGPAYIAGLLQATPSTLYLDEYAETIRKYSQRRRMIEIATRIAKDAYNIDSEPDIGEVVSNLYSIGGGNENARHVSADLSQLLDEIEERVKNPVEYWGYQTGFQAFDRVTGGLQPDELLIVSGKPGQGKSIFAMQMGIGLAANGHPGVIYSKEMKATQVLRRALSAQAKVPTRAIKQGKLSPDQYADVMKATEELSHLPLFIEDTPWMTTTQLAMDIARMKARHGIQWFAFDYMLLAGDAPELSETERTAIISRNIRVICRNENIAGIAIHSMNKTGLDAARPEQQNLRGSGQVSYDADLIGFLTDFFPYTAEDAAVPQDLAQGLATFHFGKGRELDDPKKYFHLVKEPKGYPQFHDYMTEPKKGMEFTW